MGWWDEVRVALQGFLDQHGVLAGFLMILIEEAGVPVPVPGDFLMLALGVHAPRGASDGNKPRATSCPSGGIHSRREGGVQGARRSAPCSMTSRAPVQQPGARRCTRRAGCWNDQLERP